MYVFIVGRGRAVTASCFSISSSLNRFGDSHLQRTPQRCPQFPRGSSQVFECDGEQQVVFGSRETSASAKLGKKKLKSACGCKVAYLCTLCVEVSAGGVASC